MDKVYVVIHEHKYGQTVYVTNWTAESTKDWNWIDFIEKLTKINPEFEFDDDEDNLTIHPDCPIYHTGE